MKRDTKIAYRAHRFVREPNWHKCRALVDFDVTSSDGKSLGEITIKIDISDTWLSPRGAYMASNLPPAVFCEALSIATPKIYARRIIQKVGPILVKSMDGTATSFSSPSECMIEMNSEHGLTS